MTAGVLVAGLRVITATSRNARRRNEDAIGLDGWVLFADTSGPMETRLRTAGRRPATVVIADGLGGAPDGHHAARLGARLLSAPDDTVDAPETVLPQRFRRADQAIREHAAATGGHGSACTAALLLVYADGAAVVANVGDVRVYRIQDTYAGQLTEDHRVHTGDSAVSRCLGGVRSSVAEPFVYRAPGLCPGDRLLICSDGVHDAVSDPGIGTALRHPDPLAAADELVRAAVAAGHGDNVTLAIVDVAGPSGVRTR